eukprot:gene18066-21584_t
MAFGKNRKYKKVVKAIFPSQPGGEMQLHNISKLVYFCEMNPEQLRKVAPYIQAKAEKNLNKKRLEELIIGCRKNLLFFSPNATELMKLMLCQNAYPDLQIEATETFIRFASVQDDASQFQDIEFIHQFINMCNNNNADDFKRRRIRGEGLRGISAYISILDLDDELETFITKHMEILSTILNNMQYRDQIPPTTAIDRENNPNAALPADVRSLATECLRDLSGRVNNITVNSLVGTILKYLDDEQKWHDDFPVECMSAVSKSVKPQHYSFMLTTFLRHLEQAHPLLVTKKIVHTAVDIVNDSTGSINQVVSHLLKILIVSIDQAHRKPPPSDFDEQLKLQSMIIDSIGTLAKKLRSSKAKMETMNHIMNHIKEATKTHTEGINTILLHLTQCILQVSQTLHDVIPPATLNDLMQKLIDYSVHSSYEVRILIQKIFHTILLPNKSYEQLVTSQGLSVTVDGVDELLKENASFVRDSLFNSFLNTNNHPENIIVLFKTLTILLYRGKSKEIQYSIPMIFKIQKLLARKANYLLARSIHLAITSYLVMVARLYNKAELESYAVNVIKTREENNHACKYLSFEGNDLVIKNNRNRYRQKEANKETKGELIDQDKVAEFLCSIGSLNQEYPNLRTVLSKKYNTITRTDLELPQDEVTELSPPVKTIPLDDPVPNTNITAEHPKITYDTFRQYSNPIIDGSGSVMDKPGQRNSMSNNPLLFKDLTYQHVTSICESNGEATQKEHDLLMRLVKAETYSSTDCIDDDKLSSTCTINMAIQTFLEKVF